MSGRLEAEGFTKTSQDKNGLEVKSQTAKWMEKQNKRKQQTVGWKERQIIERSFVRLLEFECKVFEEKFDSKEDLIAHMKFTHGDQEILRTRIRTAMIETVRKVSDRL